MHLTALEREEGGSMLVRYLEQGKSEEIPELSLAGELSDLVGELPVAIAYVAGYVAYSHCPLEELVQIFHQRQQYASSSNDFAIDSSAQKPSFTYEQTRKIVWNIALCELPRDAYDLIAILSYMNGGAVAENLLCAVHQEKSLDFLDIREPLRCVYYASV